MKFVTLTVCSSYTFVIGIITLAILYGYHVSLYNQYALLISAGLLILCVATLKIITKVQRPKNSKLTAWGHSFPSGHATLSAFFVCSVLYYLYLIETKTTPFVWALFFGLLFSIALGLTRIQYKLHFWQDVIFGWILGIYWFSLTNLLF